MREKASPKYIASELPVVDGTFGTVTVLSMLCI